MFWCRSLRVIGITIVLQLTRIWDLFYVCSPTFWVVVDVKMVVWIVFCSILCTAGMMKTALKFWRTVREHFLRKGNVHLWLCTGINWWTASNIWYNDDDPYQYWHGKNRRTIEGSAHDCQFLSHKLYSTIGRTVANWSCQIVHTKWWNS